MSVLKEVCIYTKPHAKLYKLHKWPYQLHAVAYIWTKNIFIPTKLHDCNSITAKWSKIGKKRAISKMVKNQFLHQKKARKLHFW